MPVEKGRGKGRLGRQEGTLSIGIGNQQLLLNAQMDARANWYSVCRRGLVGLRRQDSSFDITWSSSICWIKNRYTSKYI
jgi:hypothetical protein